MFEQFKSPVVKKSHARLFGKRSPQFDDPFNFFPPAANPGPEPTAGRPPTEPIPSKPPVPKPPVVPTVKPVPPSLPVQTTVDKPTVVLPPTTKPSVPPVVKPTVKPPPPPVTAATPTTPVPSPQPSTVTSVSVIGPTVSPVSLGPASVSSAAPSPSTTGAAGGNKVSGAAAGIALGLLAIGIIGLAAFFIRKRVIAKRERRRDTWVNGLYPALESKKEEFRQSMVGTTHDEKSPAGYQSEKPLPVPIMSDDRSQSPHPSFSAQSIIMPPPNSLNNPSSPALFQPSSARTSLAPSMHSYEVAVVRRAFLPSLPDELNIQQGESIHIITAYDDGWCLCLNPRGERGVVPLECLSRSAQQAVSTLHGEMSLQEANTSQSRMSKRASSLFLGGAPQGGY